jgi:hypothetical protein
MPNDCENSLIVSGSEEDMNPFYAKFSKEILSFNDFVPRPPSQEHYWYDWNVEHWGTKWDAYDESMLYDKGLTSYEVAFTTAWSPPIAFAKRLAEMFPKLTIGISFFEPGMQFLGYYKWKDGTEVEKICYEYMNDQELRDLYNTHTTEQRAAWSDPYEDEEEEDERDLED